MTQFLRKRPSSPRRLPQRWLLAVLHLPIRHRRPLTPQRRPRPLRPPWPSCAEAAAKPAVDTKAIDAKFKNEREKFSYMVGMDVARSLWPDQG